MASELDRFAERDKTALVASEVASATPYLSENALSKAHWHQQAELGCIQVEVPEVVTLMYILQKHRVFHDCMLDQQHDLNRFQAACSNNTCRERQVLLNKDTQLPD